MTFEQTQRMLQMWRGGADTMTIAGALMVPEAVVANQLAFVRDFFAEMNAPPEYHALAAA